MSGHRERAAAEEERVPRHWQREPSKDMSHATPPTLPGESLVSALPACRPASVMWHTHTTARCRRAPTHASNIHHFLLFLFICTQARSMSACMQPAAHSVITTAAGYAADQAQTRQQHPDREPCHYSWPASSTRTFIQPQSQIICVNCVLCCFNSHQTWEIINQFADEETAWKRKMRREERIDLNLFKSLIEQKW